MPWLVFCSQMHVRIARFLHRVVYLDLASFERVQFGEKNQFYILLSSLSLTASVIAWNESWTSVSRKEMDNYSNNYTTFVARYLFLWSETFETYRSNLTSPAGSPSCRNSFSKTSNRTAMVTNNSNYLICCGEQIRRALKCSFLFNLLR